MSAWVGHGPAPMRQLQQLRESSDQTSPREWYGAHLLARRFGAWPAAHVRQSACSSRRVSAHGRKTVRSAWGVLLVRLIKIAHDALADFGSCGLAWVLAGGVFCLCLRSPLNLLLD